MPILGTYASSSVTLTRLLVVLAEVLSPSTGDNLHDYFLGRGVYRLGGVS